MLSRLLTLKLNCRELITRKKWFKKSVTVQSRIKQSLKKGWIYFSRFSISPDSYFSRQTISTDYKKENEIWQNRTSVEMEHFQRNRIIFNKKASFLFRHQTAVLYVFMFFVSILIFGGLRRGERPLRTVIKVDLV